VQTPWFAERGVQIKAVISEQKSLQRTAREFAQEVLKPVVAAADAEPDTQKAFPMMQPCRAARSRDRS
jgi:hypothetical protein